MRAIGSTEEITYKYSPHRGHFLTLESQDEDDNHWLCSCGDRWTTANDPEGNLGSSEAPEG